MSIISVAFPGCFTGGSGSSDNPVSSAVTPTDADSPVRAGTATVSFVIVVPEGESIILLRASTVKAALSAPYATITISNRFTKDIIQRKSVPVVDGAMSIELSGLPGSTQITADLELVGCHIAGYRKFTGNGFTVSGQTLPMYLYAVSVDGILRTSDGKTLTEVGECFNGKITFNENGDPIGIDSSRNVKNYSTGETLINLNEITTPTGYPVSAKDIAWYDGSLIVNEVYSLQRINLTTKVSFVLIGDPFTYSPTVVAQGKYDTLTAPVGIDDIQVLNGRLYANNAWSQMLIVDSSGVEASAQSNKYSVFSITESGRLLVFDHSSLPGKVGELTNFTDLHEIITWEREGIQTGIEYDGGLLLAGQNQILKVKDGQTEVWLPNVATNGSNFFIYKNSVGQIYVCSEVVNKIWKVQ
jgi:hypothetical protein